MRAMMENDGAQAPPGTVDWLRPYVRQSALLVEPWVKKRRTGLNLSSNEFVHPAVDRAVADALRDIDPHRISGYADPQELADALAAYHGIEPERLVVTAGSDDAVRCLAA